MHPPEWKCLDARRGAAHRPRRLRSRGVRSATRGGAVLASLADTLMPEAFEHGRPLNSMATAGRFLVSFILSGLSVMLAARSGSQRARVGLPERANHESEGVPTSHRHHREDGTDKEIDHPLIPVGLLGGPGPQRAEPAVDRQVYCEG